MIIVFLLPNNWWRYEYQYILVNDLAGSGEAVWKKISLLTKRDTQKRSLLLLILLQLDAVVTGTAAAILQPWGQARVLNHITCVLTLLLLGLLSQTSCYMWYTFFVLFFSKLKVELGIYVFFQSKQYIL